VKMLPCHYLKEMKQQIGNICEVKCTFEAMDIHIINVPQLSNLLNSLRCEISLNWPLLKWKSCAGILESCYFNV